MPILDGLEATKQIINIINTPIIGVTANSSTIEKNKCK